MANKRVSELSPITVIELTAADLLLLADITAQESKKLTLGDLSSYILSGGNISGSFYGTASYATIAASASYVGQALSASYSLTASYALNGGGSGVSSGGSYNISASYASQSLSASYALSASQSLSASYASFAPFSGNSTSSSYLIFAGVPNGTASFAQMALTAAFALNGNSGTGSLSSSFATAAGTANTASYLQYTSLRGNGTASFAISASDSVNSNMAISSSHALSADIAFIGITTNFQSSASYASSSISASYAFNSNTSINSQTASYVIGNAAVTTHGIFSAITQSITSSQIDVVTLTANSAMTASFDVNGTLVIPYTASIALSESVTLHLLNRTTGIDQVLDMSPVYYFMGNTSTFVGSITGSVSGTVTGSVSGSSFSTGSLTGSFTGSMNGVITNLISGSFTTQFGLMGSNVVLSDDYMLYITASSNKIRFASNRLSKFGIDINVGSLSVSVGNPLVFYTDNPDYITFFSTDGGPFNNLATNMTITGSNKMLQLDLSTVFGGAHNIWTMPNMYYISCSNATSLTSVSGMPTSLLTMSFQTSSLTELKQLDNTSITKLICTKALLSEVPSLPTTMLNGYIDFSQNPIGTISTVPIGTTRIYFDATNISTPPNNFPNSIVSMSFSNNTNLSSWMTTLPSSLCSFYCRYNPLLTTLPTIPSTVRQLDVSYNNLTDISQDSTCADLVSGGLLSGSLNIRGNATLLSTTLTRIATLQSRAWTVTYV